MYVVVSFASLNPANLDAGPILQPRRYLQQLRLADLQLGRLVPLNIRIRDQQLFIRTPQQDRHRQTPRRSERCQRIHERGDVEFVCQTGDEERVERRGHVLGVAEIVGELVDVGRDCMIQLFRFEARHLEAT